MEHGTGGEGMTYEPKHLRKWTKPDHYAGASWPEYYVFLGQHRDSDLLTQSNFDIARQRLGGESETVVVVCETHWAVGWVEWIGIHESDAAALEAADDMAAALEDYPVLNEDDWSEREWNAAHDWWRDMGLQARIEVCARFGVSIFAARRKDELPRDDTGAIFDYLISN